MPPTTDIGNSFAIGDPKSPSHTARLEWLLNQMRLSLAASANPPNYTAILSQIFGAVDELELKADQINLTNSQINLNVDQVESLISTAIARLNSLLIAALQSDNKLASLLISANLQDTLLNAISSATSQILIEQPIQTAYLSQVAALLNNVSAEISTLIAPDLDAIKFDVNAILGALGILGYLLNELQSTNSILSNIYDSIRVVELFYCQPLNLNDRQVFDIAQIIQQPLNFPQGSASSQREIINCTGDRTGNPKFQAWIYGKFLQNGQSLPINPGNYYDHDFVIGPGERLQLGRKGINGFNIAAEGGGAETGNIIVNIFETF